MAAINNLHTRASLPAGFAADSANTPELVPQLCSVSSAVTYRWIIVLANQGCTGPALPTPFPVPLAPALLPLQGQTLWCIFGSIAVLWGWPMGWRIYSRRALPGA